MSTVWKDVKVFISSTFRDMHSERDWLVKRVFPALREKLHLYRIHLIDVDLRWGVTQEQADNGKALDVCLQQIDECRPLFLGLLGDRYGWVPKTYPDEAVSKYGWIQHETGKSITELEILHGVLRKHEMHSRAFFFFRDSDFVQDVPDAKRSDVESESMEEGADKSPAEKLEDLKQEIRKADLPVPPTTYTSRYQGLRINWNLIRLELSEDQQYALHEMAEDNLIDPYEYASLSSDLQQVVNNRAYSSVCLDGLEEFGQQVHDQLWEAIRAEHQLGDEPADEAEVDPLTAEAEFHERFMESRLRIYVGREKIRRSLMAFAEGNDAIPCLVTGPSGSGKSAAMSDFVRTYRVRHPGHLVIPHFVGSSPKSTSLRAMLQRLCLELNAALDLDMDVPEDVNELSTTFRESISKVPADRNVLLVIDALNQLDDTDNAHELHWLPRDLPSNVKLVASCIDDPGRTERVLEAMHLTLHAFYEIDPLTDDDCLQIITDTPSLSAKSLDDNQIKLLLDNPATRSPLFLLVALEELRGFGTFEQLSARIRQLPREGDVITDLFLQVIDRLEGEFNRMEVRSTLTLLACARRGISERELLELIHGAGTIKSSSDVYPIIRQIRPYLQTRADLLDFFHRNFYKAVRIRYLADDEVCGAVHQTLAEYFERQATFLESLENQQVRVKHLPPTPRPANIRKLDELPWQTLQVARLVGHNNPAAIQWDGVADLLTNWQFLEAKVEAGVIFDLIEDFVEALSSMPRKHLKWRTLLLLHEAIRRDIHFIDSDPTTLFQCMWNTCWWYDCDRVAGHYLEPKGGWTPDCAPWLMDDRSKLSPLLEKWRAAKERIQPGFPWLRSHRPPPLHLGTGQNQVLRGHESGVNAVVISSDGRFIASGSDDATVRIWEASSGKELACFRGHRRGVTSLAISNDGRWLVSGSKDGSIRLWDIVSGIELQYFRGHSYPVNSVAFLVDNQRIVSGSADKTFRVWDIEQGKEIRCHPWSGDGISGSAISPDGSFIAGGSQHGDMFVWNTATGEQIKVLSGHKEWVTANAWSSDGRRILSGSMDQTVQVWDAKSGEPVCRLEGHEERIVALAISPDGRHVASASIRNRTLRMWDAVSGEQTHYLRGHDRDVTCLTFSPDSRLVISGGADGTIRVCNTDGGQDTRSLIDEGVDSIAFSNESRWVACGTTDGTIGIWDFESGEKVRSLAGHDSWVRKVKFSADDQRVVSWSCNFETRILDTDTGKELHVLPVNAAVMSVSDRQIVIGGGDTIHVFDTATGREVRRIPGSGFTVASLTISADGLRIVIGAGGARSKHSDFPVNLLDAKSGHCLQSMFGHKGEVKGVALSDDQTRILSVAEDRTVRLWDAETGKEILCLKGHQGIPIRAVFSGEQIISSAFDNTVRIWDIDSGVCMGTIKGGTDMALLADGIGARSLCIIGHGSQTSIQQLASGEFIGSLPTHLENLVTHRSGTTWAGRTKGGQLHIVTLEGEFRRR